MHPSFTLSIAIASVDVAAIPAVDATTNVAPTIDAPVIHFSG